MERDFPSHVLHAGCIIVILHVCICIIRFEKRDGIMLYNIDWM